jgi:hypothetical protein
MFRFSKSQFIDLESFHFNPSVKGRRVDGRCEIEGIRLLAQEAATDYPGDIIDGIVYLRGPLQDNNHAVSIKLVGSTHSTIFLGKHSVDYDLVLCEVRQELYVGLCSLEKGKELSWPVGIQVPQHTYNFDGHSKSRHGAQAHMS